MRVFFADPRLRERCESDRELRRCYGAEGARKVGLRLQALRAAESLDDVMAGPGKCHPLHGTYYKECFALSLHAGYRLVFRLMTAGERDGAGLVAEAGALVIEIIDYHD